MPRPAATPVERSCAECGALFTSTRKAAFCVGTSCRQDFNNRRIERGRVALPYLMAWVEGKGGGHRPADPRAMAAMRELTTMTRIWIDEDRSAKPPRPSLLSYVEAQMADTLYIDRMRH